MNLIDIVLGALLVYAAYRGATKGLFIELASIAALLLGIWGAVEFSWLTQTWITEELNWNPEHIGLISFILTFLVVVVLVHLVARLADQLFKAIALGILTRMAGLIVGVVKTAFILSVLIWVIEKVESYTIQIIPEEEKEASIFYEPISKFAPNILPFFHFEEGKEMIKEDLKAV